MGFDDCVQYWIYCNGNSMRRSYMMIKIVSRSCWGDSKKMVRSNGAFISHPNVMIDTTTQNSFSRE